MHCILSCASLVPDKCWDSRGLRIRTTWLHNGGERAGSAAVEGQQLPAGHDSGQLHRPPDLSALLFPVRRSQGRADVSYRDQIGQFIVTKNIIVAFCIRHAIVNLIILLLNDYY